jgi:hypothetical protein
MVFDSNAGEITNLLPETGETVKKGGLARVGGTNNSYSLIDR